jgi:peptidyl-tRNA hydrolase
VNDPMPEPGHTSAQSADGIRTELPSGSFGSLAAGPAPAEFLTLKAGPASAAEVRALLA